MTELEKEAFPAPAAPSINKTPFLVFDGILVVTALLLALTSGGPLSPLLFFWILFCVAAGGVVACLPFWIEFRDRMRLAEYELRERQSGVGNTQWQYLDARLSEMAELLQKNHLRLADCADRIMQLEARPAAPQAEQLAELSAATLQQHWPHWRQDLLGSLQSGLAEASAKEQEHGDTRDKALREELAELKRSGDALGQSLQEHLQARQSAEQATGEALAALQERIGLLSAAVTALAAAPLAAAVLAPAPQPKETDAAEAGAVETDTAGAAPAAQSAEPEALEALSENTALEMATLDDALDEPTADESDESDEPDEADEPDTSDDFSAELDEPTTEAVNESAEETVDELPAEPFVQLDDDFAAEPDFSDEPEPQSATEDEFVADTYVADSDVADVAASADEDTATATPEADAADESEAAAPATEPAAESVKPAVEQPVLLETPEVAVREKKPAAGVGKTTLVAQVLIGIGNKPYVRGSGPGLSLEKGVPMQFVEIGKWEWVCPQGSEPVSIQIYKNDEVPCTLGMIDIEAGQRRAVTPVFPK